MTNNKQQTAVEWLEEEMLKPNLSMKEILEQAKEMEKEHMCKFAYKCHNHHKVYGDFNIEQYYNETYVGGKQ
jgi:hypothetical protein